MASVHLILVNEWDINKIKFKCKPVASWGFPPFSMIIFPVYVNQSRLYINCFLFFLSVGGISCFSLLAFLLSLPLHVCPCEYWLFCRGRGSNQQAVLKSYWLQPPLCVSVSVMKRGNWAALWRRYPPPIHCCPLSASISPCFHPLHSLCNWRWMGSHVML